MALILNIDTSGKQGLVSLAKAGICISSIVHEDPMQHASFLHPAILQLMEQNKLDLQQLDAIAVSNGPGSYTGLRVGLASAKGLCYALNKALITISTLQVMAKSASTYYTANQMGKAEQDGWFDVLYCPMIDARRMEVFFAVYNGRNEPIISPSTAVLDTDFLNSLLSTYVVVFSGSGAAKWQNICLHAHAVFVPEPAICESLCQLSYADFMQSKFANLAGETPFYCKEFYTPAN